VVDLPKDGQRRIQSIFKGLRVCSLFIILIRNLLSQPFEIFSIFHEGLIMFLSHVRLDSLNPFDVYATQVALMSIWHVLINFMLVQ